MSPKHVTDAVESREAARYRPGYEVTAEHVLEFIASRGLQPGDRLPTEIKLAAELGVSRSVLREAVKVLSALGRVRAEKGRGLYVADEPGLLSGANSLHFTFMPGNLDHVFMLFEFRRTQEVAASRLAATRATPAELGAIGEAAHRCLQSTQPGRGDMQRFVAGDHDFHHAVATASHNPFLGSALLMARRLQGQSAIIGLKGRPGGELRTAAEEHIVIYEAIRTGRAEEAAAAAAAHIEHTQDDYRREIQRRLFS
jgi:DNA-binding FadR family transcriptional regulator